MTPKSRLRQLLSERSVQLGDFTLASGARSPYYIDARRTTMCGEGQALVGEVGLAALAEAGWEPTHVGGMTLGADPISYAMAHRGFVSGKPLDAFTVRKIPKGHGSGSQIEGGLRAGDRVVVVEDSITTGGSVMKALEVLESHGAQVLGVLTLVDREEGAEAALKAAGYTLRSVFKARELVQLAEG